MSIIRALKRSRAAACALVLALAAPQAASPQQSGAEADRPADVATWVTIGTTMRMDRDDAAQPRQMRQVLMAPEAYRQFVETRRFADGAALAVIFHAVARDDSHAPPLYHATEEEAFALEIIDRSHPDGRRFYTFAPGQARAAALPPGNQCAQCHVARGSFDGTFAHLYPALAPYAADE